MTQLKWILATLAGIALSVWANNTSMFVDTSVHKVARIIAHRGVHQSYAGDDRTNDTCTANPIAPMTHEFIANTLPSIQAAFDYGADVVEVDVHLTPDPIFAVFHDWRLECQTNGQGVTHKQSYATLAALDAGYGYTVDGETYPLRGKGVGLIPTLTEVLRADVDGTFLVNFKSNRAQEGEALAELLQDQALRNAVFGVYGGGRPTNRAIEKLYGMRGFDRAGLKVCLKNYAFIGWLGHVPASCRDRLIAIPVNYAPYLWGWPHKFTQRMAAVGTDVILWGPYDGSGFSSGIDTVDQLKLVPDQFDGYVWTNRVEVIGPLIKSQ